MKPWIILKSDGGIQSAHCTCMAGLGEACSHVAALVFYIHLKHDNSRSCTDRLSEWTVPAFEKNIQFKRIKDIDFEKPIKSFESKQLGNFSQLFQVYNRFSTHFILCRL